MSKVIYEDEEFQIVKAYDFVVVRKNQEYDFHSHFVRHTGARSLIRLFYKHVLPENQYFLEAMKRVTTVEEFEKLAKPKFNVKQSYRNINNGNRR
jgi:hypothetical protein